MDNVKLAHRIVQRENTCEGIIRGPRKTTLLKLCELNYLRVPVNSEIEAVRRRSSVLNIDHICGKTTANRCPTRGSRDGAEKLILVGDKRLVCTIISCRNSLTRVTDPRATRKSLEGSILGVRNWNARGVGNCLYGAEPTVKA